MAQFARIAPGVYVAREPKLSMNTGLVVGESRALLVDTSAGPESASRVWEAAREITDVPLDIVLTHAHYDHILGVARLRALGAERVWAHPDFAAAASLDEGDWRAAAVVDPSAVPGAPDADIPVPDSLLEREPGPSRRDGAVRVSPREIDLGGVTASLFWLGRGHTDHDLLVGVGPVLFAGDLVEEGGDPHFAGSFPDEWVRTLGKITALEDLYSVVVPGHGEPVTMDAVRVQRAAMRQAVGITRSAMRETSTDLTKAVPILPYGPSQSRALLQRLRDLDAPVPSPPPASPHLEA
ncbi:MBL fold metallo-hydrolase [Falsarthrobacter nasiphocae]|uniref:Glyoxylase-like metal-dependent hydrolase (Beta-lactamase superfamily II) n=1 Tax=Falsarthrobacter nasiphocae TaxID=189863 RepID=A0AAE3YI90_9MICC|nr:MBL fold metallo-hydrolase [Falsarthrobacter nasiphocae]MDR6892423.1 glyoxylase-like metal-dependent hydrolase (beta-lactamase superfamily II) [Falsarthrobacter nasiphocae]